MVLHVAALDVRSAGLSAQVPGSWGAVTPLSPSQEQADELLAVPSCRKHRDSPCPAACQHVSEREDKPLPPDLQKGNLESVGQSRKQLFVAGGLKLQIS